MDRIGKGQGMHHVLYLATCLALRICVIAQNLVDFEQLNAKCRMQIEKCKI